MSGPRPTTDARGAAPTRAETPVAQPAPPNTIQIGQHLVDLPDPDRARTPAGLLMCFQEIELEAYADCMAGAPGGMVPPKDLAKFIWFCTRGGFDPFNDEVVGIYRGGKLGIQPTVKGFRAAAMRTGELVSISEPTYGPMVVRKLKGGEREVPEWAAVTVTRRQNGELKTFTTTCWFDDFYVADSPKWNTSPRWMLGHTRATGWALQDAFADKFSRGGAGGGEFDDDEHEGSSRAARTTEAPVVPEPEKPAKPARGLPAPVKPEGVAS